MRIQGRNPAPALLCCGLTLVCAAAYLATIAGSERAAVAETRPQIADAPPLEPLPREPAPQPDDPAAIAAVKEFGGGVFTDRFGRVTKVILHRDPVADADLALLEGFSELQTLNLRGASCVGPGITDAGLAHLAGLTNLRVLELSVNPGITGKGLESLRNLTQLEHLNLSNTHVTNDGLIHLQNLTKLRKLCLPCPVGPGSVLRWPRPGGGGCTQEGLPALWGLPIEELGGLFLDKDGFQYLRGLNHLRRIPVDFGSPLDTDLVHLQNFTKLEAVDVGLSDGWRDTSRLRHLSGMRSLRAVEISGRSVASAEFDPTGLPVLAKLPQLERLRLGRITDAGMAHLPELPTVRVLDLSVSEITGPGLAHLDKFPHLEALSLDPTTLTVEGLAHLPELPGLRTLYLDGTPFRGDGLTHLCPQAEHDRELKDHLGDAVLSRLVRVPGLRKLSLGRMPITDAGLAHLRHVPELEVLNVHGTPLTDAGLVHVRGLEQLRELGIYDTAISYAAADALHALRPQCRISDNWCCGCLAFEPVRPAKP